MLVVISPAKRLDWAETETEMTAPELQAEAWGLARTARNLTLTDLQALMSLSPDLARLTRERFKGFAQEPAPETLRPAAFAFAGDTYQGLQASDLDPDALAYAQDHLRILSGLYGVLRPLDGIQPYRLEMGSRLKTRRGETLYAYWGDRLAKALNAQAAQVGTSYLVNCASQEYFGAVDPKALDLSVITPRFLDDKGKGPKVISFFAKKARGAMARFILQNRPKDPQALFEFDTDGYRYAPELSRPDAPAFVRQHATPSS